MPSHKIPEASSEGDTPRPEANYGSLLGRVGPDPVPSHFDEVSVNSSGSVRSLHYLQPPLTTPTPTSLPAPGLPVFYLPPRQPAIQPALAPALKSPSMSPPPAASAGQTAKRYSRPTQTRRTKKLSDEWTNVMEPDERRRIQNRLAQRKFREKAREAKEQAERLRASQEQQAGGGFRFPHQVAGAQQPSETPGVAWANVRSSSQHEHALHHSHEGSFGHRLASGEDPSSPTPPPLDSQQHLHYSQTHLTHQMRQQTVSYLPPRPSVPSPVQPPFHLSPVPTPPYPSSQPALPSYSHMPYNLPQPYSPPPKAQSHYSPRHYGDLYASQYADRGH